MALDSIRREIRDDPSNRWARDLGWEPIFTASPGARIAIIGQAPGRRAQERRIPWDDASGEALRGWLGVDTAAFYDEQRFALVPMDFYYPGKGANGDLPPRADFALSWHPRIFAELPDVELTVLIGAYAQRRYLGAAAKRNLTETVRAAREYLPGLLPLFHPSPLSFRWRKQNPWFESDVVPLLRERVRQILDG